ncbi:lipocalin family protein [Flavobacterium sp. FZUC8N2.13]|uniref:Lipocalin family protein n=1 Tax=Flavobacterium zubiriense TaxID=3138075 RepID=A0ABV4T7U8_9FLAO
MKKTSILFLLTLMILGITFASCTKDDSGPVDMNYIAAKWNFDKSTATSGAFTVPYSTDYFKNEEGCNKDYIELNALGIAKYGNYTSDCEFEEKIGTWSQSGNKITIAITGTSFNGTFNVANLSSTDLLLKIDGSYQGQSGTFNLYFKK